MLLDAFVAIALAADAAHTKSSGSSALGIFLGVAILAIILLAIPQKQVDVESLLSAKDNTDSEGKEKHASNKREDWKKKKEDLEIERLKERGFEIGKYLTGLDHAKEEEFVNCKITDHHFVFIKGFFRKELGKIPRDSINQIIVEDRSKITQRLTMPRLLALGPFAFAFPKKQEHTSYYLLIDWEDEKGIRHNTIFEFKKVKEANRARNNILKFLKPRETSLKPDEKKCPIVLK